MGVEKINVLVDNSQIVNNQLVNCIYEAEALFFNFPESRQTVGELVVNFEQALPVLPQS